MDFDTEMALIEEDDATMALRAARKLKAMAAATGLPANSVAVNGPQPPAK